MPTSLIEFCTWCNCSFIVDGDEDETVHMTPTLEMYQSPERLLSVIWDEHDNAHVITDKNSYFFLPF